MNHLIRAIVVCIIIGLGVIQSRKNLQNPKYKSYWWVYVLILAFMSIGALLYYYI